MEQQTRYSTTVSVESRLSASAFFENLRQVLRINPTVEAIEYATEIYFPNDDKFTVRINLEFGEEDGRRLLFEDESQEDEYVELHKPYAELSISTPSDYISSAGGAAKDLHALILTELAEWFEGHGIEWGYYTDADVSGRWISGDFPARFGSPELADLDEIGISGIQEED